MGKLTDIKIKDALNIQTTECINNEFKPILDIRVQIDKEKLHDFKTICEAYLNSLGTSESSYTQEDLHSVLTQEIVGEICEQIYVQLESESFKNESI